MFLRRTRTIRPSPPSMIASAVGIGFLCSGMEALTAGVARPALRREVRTGGVLRGLVHGLFLLVVVEVQAADRDLVELEREGAQLFFFRDPGGKERVGVQGPAGLGERG